MTTAKDIQKELYSQISEATFTAQVIKMAQVFGWLVFHARPARTNKGWRTAIQGDAGFPDCLFLRGNRAILCELKSARGRVTPEQQKWLEAARAAGIEAYVSRPSDMDEIERILR